MIQSKLRSLRIEAGFSLEEIAKPLNRTRSWLSQVETGKIRVDKIVSARIAKVISQLRRETDKVLRDLRLP
jgi:transcriptional regulator with XRE-family HTH domain